MKSKIAVTLSTTIIIVLLWLQVTIDFRGINTPILVKVNGKKDQESVKMKWNIHHEEYAAIYPSGKMFLKGLSISQRERERESAEYSLASLYGLVLIKREFIGYVWVITCGNSLWSALKHSNKGGSAGFTHINIIQARICYLPTLSRDNGREG